MKSYDRSNKVKEEYSALLKQKEEEILHLKIEVDELKAKNDELRKKLYDAGQGKGDVHRLEKELKSTQDDIKHLQSKLDDLNGTKLISVFSPERQELIRKIQKLHFGNNIFNRLAYKFIDGTENVITIAARIKKNYIEDMDYYTYVFRDDIVSLLEKMLRVLTNKTESSASKYLVKLSSGEYSLPKKYYNAVPLMKNKEVLKNILCLINLETAGYHGSREQETHVYIDEDTKEVSKYNRFLNLESETQLKAIFTLLQFMYFVFTCDDWEQNLILVSKYWFKTI